MKVVLDAVQEVVGCDRYFTTPDARAAVYLPGAVARAEGGNAQHPRPDAQRVMSELLRVLRQLVGQMESWKSRQDRSNQVQLPVRCGITFIYKFGAGTQFSYNVVYMKLHG